MWWTSTCLHESLIQCAYTWLQVATCVIELQEKLPRARVLYCSATGVSEVGNLAYMSRLGLWGIGTSFADFGAFLDSMKQRGVSFLEMLAMEMKVSHVSSRRHACCLSVICRAAQLQALNA